MHYKKTVCRRTSNLLNATTETITTYTADGAITTLDSIRDIPELSLGTYVIVSEEQYRIVKENKRRTCDLVEPYSVSQGRGGVTITSLRLYDDQEIRIYPEH